MHGEELIEGFLVDYGAVGYCQLQTDYQRLDPAQNEEGEG